MLKKLGANEKIRFLIFGGVNTLVGYLLFVAVFSLFHESFYVLSYVLSYIVALFSGFTIQRIFVFKVKGKLFLDFTRYTIVQIGSFTANLILLPTFVELIGIPPLIAQAIAVLITVIASYFAHRHFSFRRKTVSEELK